VPPSLYCCLPFNMLYVSFTSYTMLVVFGCLSRNNRFANSKEIAILTLLSIANDPKKTCMSSEVNITS